MKFMRIWQHGSGFTLYGYTVLGSTWYIRRYIRIYYNGTIHFTIPPKTVFVALVTRAVDACLPVAVSLARLRRNVARPSRVQPVNLMLWLLLGYALKTRDAS